MLDINLFLKDAVMNFASVNYLAILVASIACFAWGAAWYMGLSKPWLRAIRLDPATIKPSPLPFVISFFALLVMGWVMSGVIFHMGVAGLWPTTLTVNHRYEGFGWDLTIIDGGHWLGVAVIMGAILGWWAG